MPLNDLTGATGIKHRGFSQRGDRILHLGASEVVPVVVVAAAECEPCVGVLPLPWLCPPAVPSPGLCFPAMHAAAEVEAGCVVVDGTDVRELNVLLIHARPGLGQRIEGVLRSWGARLRSDSNERRLHNFIYMLLKLLRCDVPNGTCRGKLI